MTWLLARSEHQDLSPTGLGVSLHHPLVPQFTPVANGAGQAEPSSDHALQPQNEEPHHGAASLST